MEEAYCFMQSIIEYPFEESLEECVSLIDAVSEAGVEVLFSGSPITDNLQRKFYLRSSVAAQSMGVAKEMNEQGMILKVEDAYRDRDMQTRLAFKPGVFDKIVQCCVWENSGELPDIDIITRRLSVLIAACPKTGTHMSASALDISVVDRDTGEELARGAPYLEMSELTPMNSPFVTDAARANRARITDLMKKHGFAAYPYEFWHYSAGDSIACLLSDNNTARYGPVDLDLSSGVVSPIRDFGQPLNSSATIEEKISTAVERLADVAG